MNLNKFLLVGFLTINLMLADDFSIDKLLNDIEKKTDLSEKTKIANAGVSFVYTRDDIDRMQIRNIKDILKSIYPLGYNENNYGLPDPFAYGTVHPFLSTQIRVFIDNQEITNGLYGSGLIIMGDLNTEWVDHIEIYTQIPTYEFSTEPTLTLIKLYTKNTVKDEGGKVSFGAGSYGASNFNTYYAQELEKWSYFTFVSIYDDKRKKYYSQDTELSRDKNTKFLLTTLKKENHNILLTALTQSRDTFIGVSIDGSPTSSYMDSDYIHIGYDTKTDNFSYLLTVSNSKNNAVMTDDVNPAIFIATAQTKTEASVITGEIKYNLNTSENKLTTGVKYRLKEYKFDISSFNGSSTPPDSNDLQTVSTIFLENQYFIKENSIITTGAQYSEVRNNYSIQDDDLIMYRLGHTYTTDKLTFKTIGGHYESTLEPYLINSTTFLSSPNEQYKVQETDVLLENIIYEIDNNKYELILDYTISKNNLFPDMANYGKLVSYDKDVIMKGINTRLTHKYNQYDKLFLDFGYRVLDPLPEYGVYKTYFAVIRNINTYKKFDIFNEVVFFQDNIDKKDFYDYSAGARYHYSRDLTISLKGTNLLDKAKETSYTRIDPNTFTQLEPLTISPIDKKVMLTMEYTF